jgi:hypothetical protein
VQGLADLQQQGACWVVSMFCGLFTMSSGLGTFPKANVIHFPRLNGVYLNQTVLPRINTGVTFGKIEKPHVPHEISPNPTLSQYHRGVRSDTNFCGAFE